MNDIKGIVEEIEENKLKQLYENTKGIIDEVGKFILKKKLLIYGGFAINLLLPQKHKIYKTFTMSDYDCFSKNAKVDAIELGEIMKSKGYKYIKVKKAIHKNTYKLYVNFIQVLDITQLSEKVFDKFQQITETEMKTPIYKYYKEKYMIVPFIFLISNMHFELARPHNSSYRWEKIYKRLLLLAKLIKPKKQMKQTTIPVKSNKLIMNKILKYVKTNKLPIVNDYALKFYDIQTNIYNPMQLMILSLDILKTKDELLDILKDYDCKVSYDTSYTEIIDKNYTITVSDISIKIIDANDECLSVIKKKGYILGSYDTILYFLYRQYLMCIMSEDTIDHDLWNTILSLEQYINDYFKVTPENRLSKECYGVNISLEEILKERWKEKMTLKYF